MVYSASSAESLRITSTGINPDQVSTENYFTFYLYGQVGSFH